MSKYPLFKDDTTWVIKTSKGVGYDLIQIWSEKPLSEKATELIVTIVQDNARENEEIEPTKENI